MIKNLTEDDIIFSDSDSAICLYADSQEGGTYVLFWKGINIPFDKISGSNNPEVDREVLFIYTLTKFSSGMVHDVVTGVVESGGVPDELWEEFGLLDIR